MLMVSANGTVVKLSPQESDGSKEV